MVHLENIGPLKYWTYTKIDRRTSDVPELIKVRVTGRRGE